MAGRLGSAMAEPFTLPDLPDGSIAGANLELDAAFGELERAAKGKPESQYGNTIEPATPPDWKEAAAVAERLLGRTRDLRVMARLAVARLQLQGLPGYADVLTVIRSYLETAWTHVHPLLDPEDDNDPIQRANALLMLQDPASVLRPMRDLTLASTPRTGSVTWRDIAVLNGAMEAEPGREKLSAAAIRAAFAGTDQGGLAALRAAVDTALVDLPAIAQSFDANALAGSGPDFTDLLKVLRDIQKELIRYEALAAEAADAAASEAPAADVPVEAAAAGPGPLRARGGASIQSIMSLTSRDDALHALELAAAYFRTNEPSSPLPLLIDRAKRLAPLPFLDILRDLAPDGLLQAQMVVGRTHE